MVGFSEETFDFLRDLQANNTRDWFERNRARYETQWLAPAQDFVTGMAGFMGQLDPPHQGVPRVNRSIRRINRDVRFSKDKSPYNPRLHLVFWTGDHPQKSPAFHLVLGAETVGFGAGMWGLTPAQLERYRRAVCDGAAASALQACLERAAALGCFLDEETLKRVPVGCAPVAGLETLVKRKSLVVRTREPGVARDVFAADAEGLVQTWASALCGVNRWLERHCF